jgi:hypothetical protein
MTHMSKEYITDMIQEFTVKELIEKDVRKVVEEFKHYKLVNKKFTDRLKQLGYWAYITNDYKKSLTVSYEGKSLTLYKYGEKLTWKIILDDLDRCQIKENKEKYIENLRTFDSDLEELKKIHELIKNNKNLLNKFYLSRWEWEIECAIRIRRKE